MRICKVDTCEGEAGRPGSGRGWCVRHYLRWRRHGDPLGHGPQPIKVCTIEGCDKPHRSRGWCSKHWERWSRYGSPTARLPGEIVDGKRVCARCQDDKPLGEFGKSSYTAAGITSYCRPCMVARTAERRAKNPGYKQPPTPPATARGWSKRWREQNPDAVRAQTARRRARKRGVETERFSYAEIYERDDWTCQICGDPIDQALRYPDPFSRSVDHRMPISRGGPHTRLNCQAAHLRCNMRKHAKLNHGPA